MSTVDAVHHATFARGSKTYYNSSRFFPPETRDDVYVLYGFVRTADDFVDAVPQDGDGFRAFVERYRAARGGARTGDTIIDSYAELERRRAFDPAWTDAFLHSMALDLEKSVHATLPETLEYVYGSAEVIGLFMARIMDLPDEAMHSAQMLGRAMQFINFIRDIAEDVTLGRIYLPISESTLTALDEESVSRDPDEFRRFLRVQVERYRQWQLEAEQGYRHIPRRLRVPIKTAADMYLWTGSRIERDPFIVYRKKVKPARARIVLRGLLNFAGGA